MSRKYRDFLYISPTIKFSAISLPPPSTPLPDCILLRSTNLHWHVIITQGPHMIHVRFTLGVHSLGLDTCVTHDMHVLHRVIEYFHCPKNPLSACSVPSLQPLAGCWSFSVCMSFALFPECPWVGPCTMQPTRIVFFHLVTCISFSWLDRSVISHRVDVPRFVHPSSTEWHLGDWGFLQTSGFMNKFNCTCRRMQGQKKYRIYCE